MGHVFAVVRHSRKHIFVLDSAEKVADAKTISRSHGPSSKWHVEYFRVDAFYTKSKNVSYGV